MVKILLPLLFWFLLFSNSNSQEVSSKIVPTEVLFKKSNNYDYSISPNGKYFAEVVLNNSETDILIVDIDNYRLHHKIPMGNKEVDQVYWLTSNRLLYESLGAIYAIDIDGNNTMMIANRRGYNTSNNWRDYFKSMRVNTFINMLPNNKYHILIESFDIQFYASIEKVNIFTGEKFIVLSGKPYKINKWITDANGNARLGIRANEDGVEFFKFDNKTKKLEPFKVVINGVNYPLQVKADSYINQNITLEGFGYDPNIVYLTSNVGTDKRKLMTYDIVKEEVVDVILEDVNCDVKDLDGEGITFVYDFKNGDLAGVKYTGIIPQYKWFSERYANIHTEINKQYPEFFNEIIDSDLECERLLIYQWSDDKVGNIGVFDTKDNSYAVMFHFNDELNEFELSKTKNIVIKTRDGFNIPCYLNFPPNYNKDNKLPLVVIPHGGPWLRDYWGLDEYVQYFATRGYVTLRVNFRGSTGFGKNHVISGMSSLDGVMIDDIIDATNLVTDKYNIDKQKVFIFGHSYGGYATYMSILNYPEVYTAGVAVSAPTDIKVLLKKQKKEKRNFSYDFWIKALGTKSSKYLSEISPINYTESINQPLLIFHGKKDRTIPFQQAVNMNESLKENGKNVKIEILQNEGHSISDSNTLGYVLDTSNDFFKSISEDKEE